jgi:hypothetical protein
MISISNSNSQNHANQPTDTITVIAVRPLLWLIEPYNIALNDILQNTLIDESMLKNDRFLLLVLINY